MLSLSLPQCGNKHVDNLRTLETGAEELVFKVISDTLERIYGQPGGTQEKSLGRRRRRYLVSEALLKRKAIHVGKFYQSRFFQDLATVHKTSTIFTPLFIHFVI